MKKHYMLCVENRGYETSLEVRKIYEVLIDKEADKHHQVRVVDESGEDSLYSVKYFAPVRKAVEFSEREEDSAEDKMTPRKEKFEGYQLSEYPEVKDVTFPSEIHIAYAICGKACGNREFLVDGQSQVCQYCGKLMFRTEVAKYNLSNKE